ncbi:unnamed protein product [Alopecurus aequalis]
MAGNPRRSHGSVLAGRSAPLDTTLLNFISHHGIEKVSEIITNLGDCTKYETREAFGKMASDLNSKPFIVEEDGDEDQDMEDEEDEDVDDGEEDEDEADVEACEFGDTKRASLVKRLHAPIEGEQEQKKPRVAEGSCVQGD